jgi:hypothetical protein
MGGCGASSMGGCGAPLLTFDWYPSVAVNRNSRSYVTKAFAIFQLPMASRSSFFLKGIFWIFRCLSNFDKNGRKMEQNFSLNSGKKC